MNRIAREALDRSAKRLELPQWEPEPIHQAPAKPVAPSSTYDSRTADKFVARLPDGVRARVAAQAELESRSMNSLVVLAVEQYLDNQEQHQIIMSALVLLKQQLQAELAAAKAGRE